MCGLLCQFKSLCAEGQTEEAISCRLLAFSHCFEARISSFGADHALDSATTPGNSGSRLHWRAEPAEELTAKG